MPVEKLKTFLNENRIRYVQISHSPAYTAQELAEVTHIPGKELAKSVVAKLDGKMTLLVLPGSYKIDFSRLEQATRARSVEVVTETECEQLFPGCESGAMSPFGNLYGLDVIVESVLTEDRAISFNGGTHTELIQLYYEDFQRLVEPKVAKFCVPRV